MDKSVKSILNRRATLLHIDNKTVPTHHEAMTNLGNFLGEIVLNEMSPMAKEMMGVGKPFSVAPKTVWLSPDDRIDGNIVLKPPPNEDVIKALTHEGILVIGSTVEERLEKHWEARIKAARKEVEDFERFECNNRIQFALQQERLAHEAAMKQQREDLLKMFQKDRGELIEESRTQLATLQTKLVTEHKIKRDRAVRLSAEQTQLSSSEKINELTERVNLLEDELEVTEKMVVDQVEKRKQQDWHILHEMFLEMHRQFTSKLQFLHNQHNTEIRQLYLEVKTNRLASEQTTTYNDSEWEDDSMNSECEEQKMEFSSEVKPFMISVCKVEGESIEDEQSPKEDGHSSESSFKCYQHLSKPTGDNVGEEPFDSLYYTDSISASIRDLKDINTMDVSCNILRRLGLNFNVANIKKVKDEVDNLVSNLHKVETKLLTVTDSLEFIKTEAVNASHHSVPEYKDSDREEYKRIMNRKKYQNVRDANLAVPLTIEEYMHTFTPIPAYMANERDKISIWDYQAMTDEEWNNLLEELDDKLHTESTESNSRNKTVTVTSPNSVESSAECNKIPNSNTKKPSRGILRLSVENRNSSGLSAENDVFQTGQMQTLVEKFNE